MKKIIRDKTLGEERALYGTKNAVIENCLFEGKEDGESAMKECEDIEVVNCRMDLRYPLWHVKGLKINGGEMTENCRAAMWYDVGSVVENCRINGIKALRECEDSVIADCEIVSPEFGWQSAGIDIRRTALDSQYAFLHSRGIKADRMTLKGKYTFQYTENVDIKNSELYTKDAFWHSKNVTVTDSVLQGEYLAWYSENLTLVRCRIKGTQPLCYCNGLKLIDCIMEDCDLSFEYSDVQASIIGRIESVKNPRSGTIIADSFGDIVITSDSVYPPKAEIKKRIKQDN